MKSQSISLRGETHQALKDHAATLGMTASPLAQEWLSEYAPFTDRCPAEFELPVQAEEVPMQAEEVPVASVASVEPVPPMVTAIDAPKEQPTPEPLEAKVHPEVPLDPPERDTFRRTRLYVTHPGDSTLKPPTSREPDGGGIISF